MCPVPGVSRATASVFLPYRFFCEETVALVVAAAPFVSNATRVGAGLEGTRRLATAFGIPLHPRLLGRVPSMVDGQGACARMSLLLLITQPLTRRLSFHFPHFHAAHCQREMLPFLSLSPTAGRDHHHFTPIPPECIPGNQ